MGFRSYTENYLLVVFACNFILLKNSSVCDFARLQFFYIDYYYILFMKLYFVCLYKYNHVEKTMRKGSRELNRNKLF